MTHANEIVHLVCGTPHCLYLITSEIVPKTTVPLQTLKFVNSILMNSRLRRPVFSSKVESAAFPIWCERSVCLGEAGVTPGFRERQQRVRSRGQPWVCTTWPSPCWGQSLWVWAWCRPESSSHAATQHWARSAATRAGPGFPCCSRCTPAVKKEDEEVSDMSVLVISVSCYFHNVVFLMQKMIPLM